MERMDADEQDVVVLVEQFDHLLFLPVDIHLDQSCESSHAMVDVHDVIARFEVLQLL